LIVDGVVKRQKVVEALDQVERQVKADADAVSSRAVRLHGVVDLSESRLSQCGGNLD
jgi:hypothetical protein